jgi:hypothetical protein
MEILKPVAIVASAAGTIYLLWFLHQQNEREPSLGEGSSPARQSSAHASLDLLPPPSADVSKSKSAYSYTRFGLWVAPNAGATPATRHEPQDPLALSQGSQPTRSTLPPRGDPKITLLSGRIAQIKRRLIAGWQHLALRGK